jgi:hypothetical protein
MSSKFSGNESGGAKRRKVVAPLVRAEKLSKTDMSVEDAALPLSKAIMNSEGILIQVSGAGASRLYTPIARITALTEVVHNVSQTDPELAFIHKK